MEQTPALPKVETARHPEYKEYFTDATGISFNFFTFSLVVGRFQTMPEGHVNEQIANIAMSPEHAKLVAAQLTANVAEYEKRFGAIRALPDAAPKPTIITPSRRLV